jgi:hypothetical protein
MKTEKPGATVPKTAIYWCTVCKLPEQFTAGETFPACRNMCGKGYWQLIEEQPEKNPARG